MFRSPKLLHLAERAPHCMHCKIWNRGQVVACHSNSQRHGKGTGIKAHDLVAYLCPTCHDLLDRRTGEMPREDRDAMFLEACWQSTLWLLQEGLLKVVAA